MFNNVAIDVCLGVIFILLLYSLLASIVQEIVARWFGLRGRLLQKAIRQMLEDGDTGRNSTFINFFIDSIKMIGRYFAPFGDGSITRVFYEYPLIKYLGESNWNSKPSYISGRNFSQALIQIMRGDGFDGTQNQMQLIRNNLLVNSFQGASIDENTKRYITKLWVDSQHDIDRFALNLETWYNDTMVRVTGWYKRQTQLLLFLIGFVIAWIFNVDIIAITKILSHNNGIREQIVNLAVSHQKDYGGIVQELRKPAPAEGGNAPDTAKVLVVVQDSVWENTYRRLSADAADMQSILGLGNEKKCREDSACLNAVNTYKDSLIKVNKLDRKAVEDLSRRYAGCKTCVNTVSPYQQSHWKGLGWLLTAIGLSLGAPFWFDLLNKIMLLRGAGKRPAEDTATSGNDTTTASDKPIIKPKG